MPNKNNQLPFGDWFFWLQHNIDAKQAIASIGIADRTGVIAAAIEFVCRFKTVDAGN
jgi:hypothetical protein